jgi:hypothetical protein
LVGLKDQSEADRHDGGEAAMLPSHNCCSLIGTPIAPTSRTPFEPAVRLTPGDGCARGRRRARLWRPRMVMGAYNQGKSRQHRRLAAGLPDYQRVHG